MDILSVTGLVNYMGKIDLPISDADAPTTGIAVRPVLLRKGKTQLGLYGIGNVKDQRMHFELRSNRVRMFMPKDKDDWFNMLLVHQNRSVSACGRECKLRSMLGSSMAHRSSSRRACSMTASTWLCGATSTTVALSLNLSRGRITTSPSLGPLWRLRWRMEKPSKSKLQYSLSY
jgi:hypothetical protein